MIPTFLTCDTLKWKPVYMWPLNTGVIVLTFLFIHFKGVKGGSETWIISPEKWKKMEEGSWINKQVCVCVWERGRYLRTETINLSNRKTIGNYYDSWSQIFPDWSLSKICCFMLFYIIKLNMFSFWDWWLDSGHCFLTF